MKHSVRCILRISRIEHLTYTSLAVLALAAGPVWSGGQTAAEQAEQKADRMEQRADKVEEQTDKRVEQGTQTGQQKIQKVTKDFRQVLETEGADITVKQAQPTVTVDQPQPIVTVKQLRPEVTIKQPPPRIEVTMPEPQVTIKQPPPQVRVQMPQPNVQVEQARPRVEIDQAPPDVQVQQNKAQVQLQPAQPKVQVQQAGEAKVSIQQADPIVSFRSARQAEGSTLQGQLMSMTGNQLVGEQIVSSQGQELGEIIDVVANKQNKDVYAVVDVGGTGAGAAKGVTVPVSQIKIKQGKLTTNQSAQAIQQAAAYNETQYQPIKLNIPISEFASIEAKK